MSQTYRMVLDGVERDVPAEHVAEALAHGAKPVQPPTPAGVVAPGTLSSPQAVTARVARALPTLAGAGGGMMGAALGPAGAIGGAAVGGALGRGAELALRKGTGLPTPDGALAAAGDIAGQGAIQGGYEGLGLGLGAVGGAAGKAIARAAYRPAKSLLREFPTVVEDAIREGIPVGKLPRQKLTGADRANAKRAGSASKLEELLRAAHQNGVTFTAKQIAQPVRDLMATLRRRQPLAERDRERLLQNFVDFLNEHAKPLTPQATKELKQGAQQLATPVYRAVRRGNVVPIDQSLDAQFNSAIARGAKGALETIPGVAEREAQTRRLISVQRMIEEAELGAPPAVPLLHVPPGISVGLPNLPPSVTSRLGLGLARGGTRAALQQAPRALGAIGDAALGDPQYDWMDLPYLKRRMLLQALAAPDATASGN